MTNSQPPHWLPKVTRDSALFLSGLAGVWYFALFPDHLRPEVLYVFAIFAGLPVPIRIAEGIWASKVEREVKEPE